MFKKKITPEIVIPAKAGMTTYLCRFESVQGETFFGADRLPQIERWLETGGF